MAGKDDIAGLTKEEVSIKLPDTWPTEEDLKDDTVKYRTLQDDTFLRFYLSNDPFVYPMRHSIRGNVLVINNETFMKLPHRTGTEHDCNKIRAVFSQLGFSVIIYNNLTCSEMKKTLDRESKNDYSNHDCFIMFIMSHGDQGVVLGTDGKTENGIEDLSIKVKEIKRSFLENKSLVGKPKLFFFQACQGSQLDKGQSPNDESCTESNFKTGETLIQSEQSETTRNDAINSSSEMTDSEETPNGSTIPTDSDTYLSTATVEGYVSWRNLFWGTWYIQAIVYIFRNFACKHDLNELMTAVTNLVSKMETAKGQFKQVPQNNTTLRKKFYLFPLIHEPCAEQYDNEKRRREKLEIEIKKRDEMIASQKKQIDKEKEQRQSLENELKIRDECIVNVYHCPSIRLLSHGDQQYRSKSFFL
ncbi:unnamed protein product [Lymnaea stagnalis]|uniref:Uncharacterized protein n=1 Tax=Lymnaea stagnalis TaxID=6523 RepID=A0AAV2HHS5_LYMST